MKRLLSVMLSAVVLMASVLTVSAVVTTAAENIAVNTSAYTVTARVDVPDTVSGTMTVQIVNTNNNDLYAMDYSNERKGTSGDYYYEFSLMMPTRAQTAEYIVRVGNNVAKQDYTFPYTNIEDKITFYNGLIAQIAADHDGIDEYFNLPATKVPVDIAAYNGLSSGVLALVNDKIAEIEGMQTVDANIAVQDKINAIIANDGLFQPAFNAAMEIALVADVSENDWETVASDAVAAGTFDNEYYIVDRTNTADDDETNDEILVSIGDVYESFKTEGAAVTSLDLVEYQKAFDRATLKVIADSLDYASVKDAFLYYQAKSIIAPDANIAELVSAGKDADLWKDLKTSGYTDFASLVANASTIAQTMKNNGATVQTTIGGGGGGAGGASTTDKPTNPGSSIGIVSDVEITPVDPVNPTQPDPVEGFTDLVDTEWSREAVEYLADAGVINGKGENSFAPNDAVTREEGAKIIVAAFDLLIDADCEFTDVAADRWSYAYIAAAVEAGILTGYGDSFGPADTMTREQAATILYRAAELIKLELTDEKTDFTDAEHASDWSRDAIASLAANGVINGMGDGTFAPKATLTRAQLAQLVYNVLVTIGGVN